MAVRSPSQERDPTDEPPAKRARLDDGTKPWYFFVEDLVGDEGTTFVHFTPANTEPARKLVAFFHEALPLVPPPSAAPRVEEDGDDSDDSNDDDDGDGGSSSSEAPSSSSEEAAPHRGVAQILMLATVPDLSAIREKYWKNGLDAVPPVLHPLLQESLAPFGTFAVEQESDEARQPSWANSVQGIVRCISGHDIERPHIGEKKKKKTTAQGSGKKHK